MLCGIYIHSFLSGTSTKLKQIEDLEAKFQKMDNKYGYFMSYDSEYHKTLNKLNMFIKCLQGERDMNVN